MNDKYLEAARQRIPNPEVLINIVSQRVRQLNSGHRPLVEVESHSMTPMEIALKEIAEGKVRVAGQAEAESEPASKPEKKKKK